MRLYLLNLIESISQVVNAIHGGDPNQTFSARCHSIREGSEDFWILPERYWRGWIWGFETLWPGHLDWAGTED